MQFVVVLGVLLSVFLLGYAHDKHAPTRNASKQRRIVGEKTATVQKFPYMASLIIKWKEFNVYDDLVGATSIISDRWAVTAAHCIRELKVPYNFIAHGKAYVRGNTTYWEDQEGEFYQDHRILLALMHEFFEDDTHDYDIAVVKVAKEFGGLYEKPIRLPGPTYVYKPGTETTVLGWGTTIANASSSSNVSELRAVIVKTIDYYSCWASYSNAQYPDFNPIKPRMMCAAGLGKDACFNDYGGPLADGNILIGVMSWTMDCANEKQPRVYTKIGTMSNWIKKTIKKH